MLSDRLRDLINTLDVTYVEFAKKVGTDGASISKYISGKTKPSRGLMNSICVVYNVNPAWLNGEEGPMFLDGINPMLSKLMSELRPLNEDQLNIIIDFVHYLMKAEENFKQNNEK